jgi:hypothetical protein
VPAPPSVPLPPVELDPQPAAADSAVNTTIPHLKLRMLNTLSARSPSPERFDRTITIAILLKP